ncbi:MAG: DUF2281 domain-containing protein [Treponema sp.]|nr:DUF2281 domain-containing protein [Treponema sp.]
MPYEILEKKIKQIPETYIPEVVNFLDLLQYKIRAEQTSQKKPKRQFGLLKGQIWMSDDFDAPLEDFKEYM